MFFDRSWYNRAVVEPVMGFCSMEKHEEFMDFIVTLEEAMRYVISRLDYPKKGSAVERLTPDSRIVETIKNSVDADRYLASHMQHG